MNNDSKAKQSKAFTEKWAQWVLKHRWMVLVSSIIAALGLGYGGSFITFDTDYRAFFSEENPQLQAFDALQEKYTQDSQQAR